MLVAAFSLTEPVAPEVNTGANSLTSLTFTTKLVVEVEPSTEVALMWSVRVAPPVSRSIGPPTVTTPLVEPITNSPPS